MKCTSLQFLAPYQVRTIKETVPEPGPGEVLIESHLSAISSGTELLAYRGHLPVDLVLDESFKGMQKEIRYPFKYGYAIVGMVKKLGKQVEQDWLGARVFAFHPHQSHFTAHSGSLIRLPDDIPFENAIFLANVETAVSFLMDGRPMIGENVLVIGLGVVGLLTTALLLRQKDLHVSAIDLRERRRAWAEKIGPSCTYSPEEFLHQVKEYGDRFDLAYELSGNPAGMNSAIEGMMETGRIIVGSWYGTRPAQLNLGGRYHRSKVSIYASQVSSIDPVLSGRWSKERRLSLARTLLNTLEPRRFITHQFSIDQAADAYSLLDMNDEEVLQVVLSYDLETP